MTPRKSLKEVALNAINQLELIINAMPTMADVFAPALEALRRSIGPVDPPDPGKK